MDCGIFVGFLLVVIFIAVLIMAANQSTSGHQDAGSRGPTAANQPRSMSSRQSTFVQRPRPRRGPRATPDQCWVGAGGSTEVDGFCLDGGMVYVGRNLPPVDEDSWRHDVEPALIDLSLPVARSRPDRSGSSMDYWPSYQTISAGARAGYLEWLAGGRRDPSAPIGFVFLFFYGIERRVLVDARHSPSARAETDALLAEVEALLGVYGENPSFRGYASSFLEVGRLLHRSVPLSELEPPTDHGGWDVPLTTKMALGAYAEQGEPIPAQWALSWVRSSSAFRTRTPAHRCAEELERLFEIRYTEHFRGGGLKIKPNKTRLSATYRAASPSFGYGGLDLTLPDLPDVTILKGPTRKLQELVDRVSDELDPYSRWIGRKDDRDSPAALALLPPELAAERSSPECERFERLVDEALDGRDHAVVPAAALVAEWPSKGNEKLTKRESEMLAKFLAPRGIGIEPDPRFGGPALGKAERAVLFRLERDEAAGVQGEEEPSSSYRAATLLLHLAVAVAAADGEVARDEERHLERHLEEGVEIRPPERHRLRHHLRWLIEEPPGMAGVKKRLEGLDEEQRQALGRFLITVAGADGRIDPEEVKILRKVYPLLGLDADSVYSDVHSLMAGAGAGDEPVTVVTGTPSEGYAIPPEPGERSGEKAGFALDPEKIKETRRASERVAGVLAEVFEEEDEAAEPAPPPEPEDGPALCGLDAAHSRFLLELAERTSWERVEIEALAERLGVFPDGALELINDAAFEVCGDPLLEGDEVVEIDREILQEMIP